MFHDLCFKETNPKKGKKRHWSSMTAPVPLKGHESALCLLFQHGHCLHFPKTATIEKGKHTKASGAVI